MFRLNPDRSHTQYRIEDERQIISPEELEVGMHIGVVTLGGIRIKERARRSAMAILRGEVSDRHDLWRVTRSWDVTDPRNFTKEPDWHGTVEDVDENGCTVALIDPKNFSWPFAWKPKPSDGPQPNHGTLSSSFQQMGLAAFGETEATEWMAEDHAHAQLVGLWEPVATLRFDLYTPDS
ncbi:MAG TPA: hypothetical protein VFX84_00810 [Candidatus Saccharimonadales bacterium]|nr:hypothetical protein [Candidatus Saccharimonadales bacterium]